MVKICLAGAESYIDLLKEVGIRYVLVSYYYVRDNPKIMKELEDFDYVILDSGAFTFYNKDANASLNERWQFVKDYVKFVNEYSQYFDVFVEFDFGSKDEVAEFRKYILENVSESEKIMPVVHPHFGGYDYYLELADQGFEYIAIPSAVKEGGASKKQFDRKKIEGVAKYLYPFVTHAHKNGIKMHVLALTKFEVLRQIGRYVYSVDSSSWLGGRYGRLHYFRNGRIENYHWKELGARIRTMYGKYPVNIEKLKKGDSNEINRACAYVWKEAQDYYDKVSVGEVQMIDDKISGFSCKNCPFADRCQFYNLNADRCILEEMYSKRFTAIEDDVEMLRLIIEERLRRYVRGRIFEDMEGGLLDKHVSHLEESTVNLIEKYLKLKYPERYGIVKIREQVVNEQNEAKSWEEKLKKIEKFFSLTDEEEEVTE